MSLNLAIELERLFFRAICLEVFLSIIDRENMEISVTESFAEVQTYATITARGRGKGSLGDGRIDVLINLKCCVAISQTSQRSETCLTLVTMFNALSSVIIVHLYS